jgi:GcrA cell cycle regulator
MSWTDERVETLKKLWLDGLSASQIATELGGVTRNAVIGKVHRIGLSGRARATTPARTAPKAKPAATPQPTVAGNLKLKPQAKPEAQPVAEVAPKPALNIVGEEPKSRRATILMLSERICKWPIGDPSKADFHFCGCPSQSSSPYCDYHTKLAYQPVRERRREPAIKIG